MMFGCSAETNLGGIATGQTSASSGTSAGGGGAGQGGGSAGNGGEGGIIFPTDDAGTPEPTGPAEVFAHSDETLYKLDPLTKEISVVGPFDGCSSVIDIAIDKDSKVIATTFDGLYWIDKTNAKCTLIANGGYPNSLSFVPAGTLDPNVEALVGYNGSTYVRIDPVSGAVTNIGSIGGGYFSSGDIVSVKGGGTYLTVNGNGCGDCLLEVDPKTGSLVKNWGPVSFFSSIYGVAFWGGSVYGFTSGGSLVEITFDQGVLQATNIPLPFMPTSAYFWGAGSTTIAPPTPPPK